MCKSQVSWFTITLPAKPSLTPVLTPQSKLEALHDFKTQSIGSCSEREYIPLFCSKKEALFIMKLKKWFTALICSKEHSINVSILLHIQLFSSVSWSKIFQFWTDHFSQYNIYEIQNNNSKSSLGQTKI